MKAYRKTTEQQIDELPQQFFTNKKDLIMYTDHTFHEETDFYYEAEIDESQIIKRRKLAGRYVGEVVTINSQPKDVKKFDRASFITMAVGITNHNNRIKKSDINKVMAYFASASNIFKVKVYVSGGGSDSTFLRETPLQDVRKILGDEVSASGWGSDWDEAWVNLKFKGDINNAYKKLKKLKGYSIDIEDDECISLMYEVEDDEDDEDDDSSSELARQWDKFNVEVIPVLKAMGFILDKSGKKMSSSLSEGVFYTRKNIDVFIQKKSEALTEEVVDFVEVYKGGSYLKGFGSDIPSFMRYIKKLIK
jgi:hypothetical protein